MKRMKKILAVLLAAIMVMSLGTSVFADESSTPTTTNVTGSSFTITVTGVASANHSMSAYQIFSGTLAKQTTTVTEGEGSTETYEYILSDIDWGSGIDSGKISASQTINSVDYASIYAALASISYTKTENETTTTVYPFTSDENKYSSKSNNLLSTAAAVADALEEYDDDSEVVNQFAEIISYYLSTTSTSLTTSDSTSTYTYSGTVSSAGYYLIKDSINSESTATDDAVSDYILKVVANAEVNTKAVVPTIEKKVSDSENGNYSSTSTASIGDTVYFKLTIETPSDLSAYESYKLVVEDTLSDGLTLADSPTISVTIGSGTATNLTTTSTNNMYYAVSDQTLTITITNLLSESEFSAGDTITITYSATLNDEATVGNDGNTNTATLTYSNNPNDSSSTGTTTETKTTTYTTSVTVTKVDGSNNDSALTGATFELYEKLEGLTSFDAEKTYVTYRSTTGNISKVDTSSGATPDSGETYYVLIDTKSASSGNSKNQATFSGLEAGTYLLVESTTPSGYNTADPIEFTLSMSSGDTPTWASTSSSETYNAVKLSENGGTYEATIQNNKGSSLPSTGGIGTTIFYVVGAVLVLGAGVILITRRRMASR